MRCTSLVGCPPLAKAVLSVLRRLSLRAYSVGSECPPVDNRLLGVFGVISGSVKIGVVIRGFPLCLEGFLCL